MGYFGAMTKVPCAIQPTDLTLATDLVIADMCSIIKKRVFETEVGFSFQSDN